MLVTNNLQQAKRVADMTDFVSVDTLVICFFSYGSSISVDKSGRSATLPSSSASAKRLCFGLPLSENFGKITHRVIVDQFRAILAQPHPVLSRFAC